MLNDQRFLIYYKCHLGSSVANQSEILLKKINLQEICDHNLIRLKPEPKCYFLGALYSALVNTDLEAGRSSMLHIKTPRSIVELFDSHDFHL